MVFKEFLLKPRGGGRKFSIQNKFGFQGFETAHVSHLVEHNVVDVAKYKAEGQEGQTQDPNWATKLKV